MSCQRSKMICPRVGLIGPYQCGADGNMVEELFGQYVQPWPVVNLLGLSLEQATNFARTMGFSESCVPSAADTMMKLYNIFIEKDALLIEINPLAEDSLGRGKLQCIGTWEIFTIPVNSAQPMCFVLVCFFSYSAVIVFIGDVVGSYSHGLCIVI